MNAFDNIATLQAQLGDSILAIQRKSPRRLYVEITPQALEKASRLMLETPGARLQIATGVDTGKGFEVMYHWALDTQDSIITLRVLVDHATAELVSIAPMCPAAEWIEREIWELLGVHFKGHPDLRHLLLADDWPQGNYPMRRNPGATP